MEESYAVLQANLNAVQHKVNKWSMDKDKELQNLKSSHTAFLDSHNELTQQLKSRERQIKSKAEKSAQEVEKHTQTLSGLDTENERVQSTIQTIPGELAELQQQLELEKENMLQLQSNLNHSDRARKHKQAQLESGHDMYEKYLGLSLERHIKGALVFKMHNVDPNEPKRQFSFAVGINDDTEQYSVTDCTPPVDCLPEMVKSLNETNSLTEFVRGLRQEWRRMLC